jgi:hypothetical protein
MEASIDLRGLRSRRTRDGFRVIWWNLFRSLIVATAHSAAELRRKSVIVSTEITHWERRRNADGAKIKRLFTVDRARQKPGREYPPTRAAT